MQVEIPSPRRQKETEDVSMQGAIGWEGWQKEHPLPQIPSALQWLPTEGY